eukprot:CAMPEP_0168855538 /NCGR_PEP_ID=MMETSP0727-20121128/14695_1 /TAXON_ID=265536 /ORGANISM="Amphiprora sp., Strain CCMP467" /LENGTH=70 /DNA_ID=CAMNT_0008909997 /DNA_START=50 /DNA_END=259 /DNA_ORIENTATION=+
MSFPHQPLHVTTALHDSQICTSDCSLQVIAITRLNNTAVACINSSQYEEAGQFFRRALNKARQTTFFDIP